MKNVLIQFFKINGIHLLKNEKNIFVSIYFNCKIGCKRHWYLSLAVQSEFLVETPIHHGVTNY